MRALPRLFVPLGTALLALAPVAASAQGLLAGAVPRERRSGESADEGPPGLVAQAPRAGEDAPGRCVSPQTAGGVALSLGDSVGRGGKNDPKDALQVSVRLVALGYLEQPVYGASRRLDAALSLFEAVTLGRRRVAGVRGLVAPGSELERWLESARAPRWVPLPGRGEGFVSFDRQQGDDHGYGTSWLVETLFAAGAHYERAYRRQHPGAALMQINDASLRQGGDTPDHLGHETGLDLDVRLPTRSGAAGTTVSSAAYDRAAARAMLRAFRAQPLVRRILFSDPALVREGLCVSARGHDNHFHVEIRPPSRAGAASPSSLAQEPAPAERPQLAPPPAGEAPRRTRSPGGLFASAFLATAQDVAGAGFFSTTPASASFRQEAGDLEVLARIVKGEALRCSFEGKVAVAAVVLNRVASPKFPDTIRGVAHQPYQFSCYDPPRRARLYGGPVPAVCYDAARAALAGRDPSRGADHYFNPYLASPAWARNMTFVRRIGTDRTNTHDFYRSRGSSRRAVPTQFRSLPASASRGGLRREAGGSAPRFASGGALAGLEPAFRARVEAVLARLRAKGWQPYVAEGRRTLAQQREKVRRGVSRTLRSRHLLGLAADIVDRRYGWGGPAANLRFAFWRDLGAAAHAEGLTWGGDWRSFPDVAHVQQ
ncbi:MAG: hypothetical protein D6731_17305 [Planctomycetota bacterium]|nr:MAG: hypothetical protein D6731_17305 [Planctomycetota bacterium]